MLNIGRHPGVSSWIPVNIFWFQRRNNQIKSGLIFSDYFLLVQWNAGKLFLLVIENWKIFFASCTVSAGCKKDIPVLKNMYLYLHENKNVKITGKLVN